MRLVLTLCVAGLLAGCTQNQIAKGMGGKMTIVLPVNTQLENVTFKQNNLWVLMKQRPANQPPTIHTFKEYSDFGVLEGTVILKEQ